MERIMAKLKMREKKLSVISQALNEGDSNLHTAFSRQCLHVIPGSALNEHSDGRDVDNRRDLTFSFIPVEEFKLLIQNS